ncbi:chitin-binding protein [Streptomyces bungoensis]|uniref:Chitin-binding protein n=1 Tax=Streptomyces bungoensis TaxID=285568 RepID=A0A124I5K5_9ACTN|nr:lytic polysaccharide monooxygenase [Streptomyces bungoensis]KUN90225.1 chitin-binding protein [Streptomyces bungoensis]
MTRTTARLGVAAAAAAAPLLLLSWAAGSAQAHGAPTDPVSRVYACSPQGGAANRSAACGAAVSANGAPFTAWDDLRVSGVAGRDRQVIPDGRLCSGNLPAYRGLDLARRDWPATRLTPGGRLTMTYASTIPHAGTFRLYLTRPGYDPAKPLTWSDLPARPFAEVKDPPLANGAYRIRATLPKDRTGRQVLYTIWRNSSTPDTYYSCSDVVFTAAGAARGTRTATASSGAPAPVPSPKGSPAPARHDAGRSGDSTPVAEATRSDSGPPATLLAGGAAAVLVLTGGAALVLRLRSR